MKKTLYKIDNKNKVREWTVEVDADKYRVITGLVDGKKVVSDWTVAEPKNIGKANATTADEQAISEAESLVQFKYDEQYHDTIELAKNTEKNFEPMLAGKFEKLISPVWSQPKLDGIRMNASKRGLYSRGGKEIVSVPHIADAIKDIMSHYDIVLDGELYNHFYKDDFNKITSIVKKIKPTQEDNELSKRMIEYHIYDMHSERDHIFSNRISIVKEMISKFEIQYPFLVMVETDYIMNEDDLDAKYHEYIAQGYEGQMVRIPQSKYEQKRSKNLLKRKPLYDIGGNDTEYEIVDIEEGKGNWSGKAKGIVCKLPDGRIFRATLKGNMMFARNVLLTKDQYIGKMATVQYQNLTPDGVPRFPIAIDLNRGNY